MFRVFNNTKIIFRNTFLQKRFKSIASLPSEADVVIIGGGIAGCSTLYQLSKRGIKAILLERAKFTSGTTWHTSGIVWSLRPNDVDIQLLAETKEIYKEVEKETGLSTGWTNNGGLFISYTKVRTDEYTRLSTFGKCFGIEGEMLSPQETKERFPMLDSNILHSTMYSKTDGHVDGNMSCTAFIKAATTPNTGCQAFEQIPVLQIQTGVNSLGNLEVKGVVTAQGVINTKCVINCGGAWGEKISKSGGLKGLPFVSMKHSYIISDSVAGVRNMPNIRDHDGALYFKIQGDSIYMGGYENNPHFIEEELPENFEFQLFDLDWSVFNRHVEQASKLFPIFGKTGIKSTVCGVETFTPDHKPIMGEDPQIFGLYHNCAYNSAGMMYSPGCALQMAKWVINGRPEMHMFNYDIRRFTSAQLSSKKWLDERCHEGYAHIFGVVFPNDESLAGRNLQVSPLHEQLLKAGAIMQSRAGWERPGFFIQNDTAPVPEYDWDGFYGKKKNTDKRYERILKGDLTFEFSEHHNEIGAEVMQCRTNAALFDMSYCGKFYLTGPDARKTASLVFTSDMEKAQDGEIVYTCALNDAGGIEADLIVNIIDNKTGELHEPNFEGRGYYIVLDGFLSKHISSHIRKIINSKGFNAKLTDVTSKLGKLALQGPNSRAILQKLTNSKLNNNAFPAFTHKIISIGDIGPCRALRIGWTGELGWELNIPIENIVSIYELLVKVGGWKHAGWRALSSLSAEKGYHLWNADIRSNDNPIEAGLDLVCRKDGQYIGKENIEKVRNEGCLKKYGYLTLDEKVPLYGNETVYRNGKVCGFIRRGDYAYYLDKSIGITYIEHHEQNTPITIDYLKEGNYEVEILGQKYIANLHLTSPFDPENKRIFGNY